jgi:hypothetical protein
LILTEAEADDAVGLLTSAISDAEQQVSA